MKQLISGLVLLINITSLTCDQKYNNVYNWMNSIVTNPFKVDPNTFCPAYTNEKNENNCTKEICNSKYHTIPMLALYQDKKIKAVWTANTSVNNFNSLYEYYDNDNAESYILTNSLMFNLAGTRLYGLIIPRKMNNIEDMYLQRITCPIHNDGTITADTIQKIDDPVCEKLTKDIGIDWAFSCTTDYIKKKFAITLWQKGKLNTFKVLIGNTTEKSYAYSTELTIDKISDITIKRRFDSEIMQHINIVSEKNSYFLEYTLKPECAAITCHTCEVAVNVDNPNTQKTISLSRLWDLAQEHVLTWPTVVAEGDDHTINPPVKRQVHYYAHNKAWPQEILKNHFEHVWNVLKTQGNDTYEIAETNCLNKYSLEKLIKIVQGMYLSMTSPINIYRWAILDRSNSKRSPDATLVVNGDGKMYLDPTSELLDIVDPEYAKRPPFSFSALYETWVKYLIKGTFPTIDEAQEYLFTNRHEALRITPQKFFNFFKNRAVQYAHRTWNNSSIGAYWSFDEHGMHIRLYDLTKKDNKKIGYYLEHYFTGVITSIEYTPGQEPIFHITN